MNPSVILEWVETVGLPAVVVAMILFGRWYIKEHEKVTLKVIETLKVNESEHTDLREMLMVIGRASLRLEIMNENFPLEERIRAYNLYVNQFQGNGYMTHYYQQVIEPMIEKQINDMQQ